MAERSCDICGKIYEAKRKTSKFCGDTCRARHTRATAAKAAATGTSRTAAPVVDYERPPLSAAVRAELEDMKRHETAVGQVALSLALRIETGMDTGSAMASLSKELRAALNEALRGAKDTQSGLEGIRDELAARRRA
jgi:hypothetical protein